MHAWSEPTFKMNVIVCKMHFSILSHLGSQLRYVLAIALLYSTCIQGTPTIVDRVIHPRAISSSSRTLTCPRTNPVIVQTLHDAPTYLLPKFTPANKRIHSEQDMLGPMEQRPSCRGPASIGETYQFVERSSVGHTFVSRWFWAASLHKFGLLYICSCGSTSLMYSFAQRSNTAAVDEPLYVLFFVCTCICFVEFDFKSLIDAKQYCVWFVFHNFESYAHYLTSVEPDEERPYKVSTLTRFFQSVQYLLAIACD